MPTPTDPHFTTAFGAIIDQEIAGALRAGMALELIYAELSARARAMADLIVAKHARLDTFEVAP